MNRAQRRAQVAREKMERNANRVRAKVDELEEALGASEWVRKFLFALVRETGRVRITKANLEALHPDDRVDLIEQENGDVVVQFSSGAA